MLPVDLKKLASGVCIICGSFFDVSAWRRLVTEFLEYEVAVLCVLITVFVNLRINRRTLKATEKVAEKNNEIQKVVAERNSSSFIADKRQVWINELRNDVAMFLSDAREAGWLWDANARRIQEIGRQGKEVEEELDKFSSVNGEIHRKIREAMFRIKLRLNPGEEHDEFRDKISRVEGCVKSYPAAKGVFAELDKLNRELDGYIKDVEVFASGILKKEWERIKSEAFASESNAAK